MSRIRADQAQPGMKVTRDVTDAGGMLLIPAGSILSERHVDLLQSWDIAEIEVEGDLPTGSPESQPLDNLTPEELKKLEAQVLARFYQFDDQSPILQEAFRLALLRQAARLKREGGR